MDNIIILASPSNFKRRKKAYRTSRSRFGGKGLMIGFFNTQGWNTLELKVLHRRIPNCKVYPLLFDFEQLSSSHLKKMMGIGVKDNQLYHTQSH